MVMCDPGKANVPLATLQPCNPAALQPCNPADLSSGSSHIAQRAAESEEAVEALMRRAARRSQDGGEEDSLVVHELQEGRDV